MDYQQLEARIAALMEDPDMVGLAIATIEGGRVRFLRGYGETLAGSGQRVTPDTVFRWASLSKGVAAAVVVGLAEEGKLALDAPLPTLGTTLSLPGDASRVTIAHILSHRVGIVRNAWDDRLEAGEDPRAIRAALGSLPPYCPPATCFTYQNIAFDAAAEIVEAAAGEPYAGVVHRRLFAPLGMASAGHGRAHLQFAPEWARPHRRERTPTQVNDNHYRVPAAPTAPSAISRAGWRRSSAPRRRSCPPKPLRPCIPPSCPPRRAAGSQEERGCSGVIKAVDCMQRLMAAEIGPVPRFTLHDLRRTAATCMQGLGLPLPVVEAVLNHVAGSRGGIIGVYQRHAYFEEKPQALQLWAAELDRLVIGKPAGAGATHPAEDRHNESANQLVLDFA